MAQELMARAERELRSGGKGLVAAEFLWGAFAHCLITVAQNEGLPHNSHDDLRQVAERLTFLQGLERWRSDFGAAEKLHVHFYHGNLDTAEKHTHTRATIRAVQQLLQMLLTEI